MVKLRVEPAKVSMNNCGSLVYIASLSWGSIEPNNGPEIGQTPTRPIHAMQASKSVSLKPLLSCSQAKRKSVNYVTRVKIARAPHFRSPFGRLAFDGLCIDATGRCYSVVGLRLDWSVRRLRTSAKRELTRSLGASLASRKKREIDIEVLHKLT